MLLLVVVMISSLVGNSATVPPSNLGEKSIFSGEYPKVFYFRREPLSRVLTYQEWKSNYGRGGGIIMKGQREEVLDLAPNILPYMQQLAQEEPDQIVVLHFNGYAGDPSYFGNAISSGHWLYYTGTLNTSAIDTEDTEIFVEDSSMFRMIVGNSSDKSDEMAIVRLDASGNKIWSETEHVRLLSIDGNRISIERNLYGLAPHNRSFAAGRAYIAPHAWHGPFGNDSNLLWIFNFRKDSPVDVSGRNASEALADFIQSLFVEGGELQDFDGIQFDVARKTLFTPDSRVIDSNFDRTGDRGFSNGQNVYGKGLYQFYELLRERLGPSKLILADGGLSHAQREVSLLNGMEAEGFSTPNNDPYLKDWSSNINRFLYWKQAREQLFEFNYVVHKDTSLPEPYPMNLTRLVLSATQALGLGVTSTLRPVSEPGERDGVWDELKRGTDNVNYWLGRPRGAMQRLAFESPDLLNGKGLEMTADFLNAWISENGVVNYDNGNMRIDSSSSEESSIQIRLPLDALNPSLVVPDGDLFVKFKTRAEPLEGWPVHMPRAIEVRVRGRQINDETADRLYGYTGVASDVESAFYYRNAGSSAEIEIDLTFEGTGSVWISDFSLHSYPDVLVREFENGIVLANPSLTDYTFDLASLFPERSFRRLTGSVRQDPITNSGLPVGATVTVGPRDGLFLIKTADIPTPQSDMSSLSLRVSFSAGEAVPSGLGWNSTSGVEYRILYSKDLQEWVPLSSPYEGKGKRIEPVFPDGLLRPDDAIFLRLDAYP